MIKKKKSEEMSLQTLTKGVGEKVGKQFMKKVQEQYVNRYADDVVKMIEDRDQLQKALNTLNKWIAAVEEGNFEYIKIYNKKRSVLAELENGDFE